MNIEFKVKGSKDTRKIKIVEAELRIFGNDTLQLFLNGVEVLALAGTTNGEKGIALARARIRQDDNSDSTINTDNHNRILDVTRGV